MVERLDSWTGFVENCSTVRTRPNPSTPANRHEAAASNPLGFWAALTASALGAVLVVVPRTRKWSVYPLSDSLMRFLPLIVNHLQPDVQHRGVGGVEAPYHDPCEDRDTELAPHGAGECWAH